MTLIDREDVAFLSPEPRAHEAMMETASGRFIDLRDPRPEQFILSDVAAGLANTCRYSGQTSAYYSVAEHAALVAWRLARCGYGQSVVLAGLHHDDAEAYIGDITRPVQFAIGKKHKKELEARVDWALRTGLALDDLPFDDPAVKRADEWALSAEAYYLLPSKGKGWYCEGYFDPQIDGVPWRLGRDPGQAKWAWLTTHHDLSRRTSA